MLTYICGENCKRKILFFAMNLVIMLDKKGVRLSASLSDGVVSFNVKVIQNIGLKSEHYDIFLLFQVIFIIFKWQDRENIMGYNICF